MVVLSKVVVVELDEAVDGLLNRAHLDQGHLVVLPVGRHNDAFVCSVGRIKEIKDRGRDSDLLKELEGLDCGS